MASKASEILYKHIRNKTLTEGESLISSREYYFLQAMKEIASIAFDAGKQYASFIENPTNSNLPPDKSLFIDKLFNNEVD